jgi:hypothetical protein
MFDLSFIKKFVKSYYTISSEQIIDHFTSIWCFRRCENYPEHNMVIPIIVQHDLNITVQDVWERYNMMRDLRKSIREFDPSGTGIKKLNYIMIINGKHEEIIPSSLVFGKKTPTQIIPLIF